MAGDDHTGHQFITGNTHTHTHSLASTVKLALNGGLGRRARNGPDTTHPLWNRLCFLLLASAGLNLVPTPTEQDDMSTAFPSFQLVCHANAITDLCSHPGDDYRSPMLFRFGFKRLLIYLVCFSTFGSPKIFEYERDPDAVIPHRRGV